MSDGEERKSIVLENIAKGAYKVPKAAKLQRPVVPDVLRKSAADLSDDEVKDILEARTKYREELELFEMAQADLQKQKTDLLNRFRLDLEAEFGTGGHPKALVLFDLATHYGQGNLENARGFYEDMRVLIVEDAPEAPMATEPPPPDIPHTS